MSDSILEAKSNFTGIHNAVRVDGLFKRFKERPGIPVLTSHISRELEPDSMVLVDHSPILQGSRDRSIPHSIMQAQCLLGILWRVFNNKPRGGKRICRFYVSLFQLYSERGKMHSQIVSVLYQFIIIRWYIYVVTAKL